MEGILLVDKPKGWTSFDVVNRVRSIVAHAMDKKPKNVKVGHTGTLDPLATGLLVVLVGKNYTRRTSELSACDKVYDVSARLGETSSTGDEEGQKTVISERQPTEQEIEHILAKFTGEILQKPPIFSAIKVEGKRAYSLARAGKVFELEARPVRIHTTQLLRYEYPFVRFRSHVSSGTYIRSLVEDIGRDLQTGAYMTDLRRERVGQFSVEDAVFVHNLDPTVVAERLFVPS